MGNKLSDDNFTDAKLKATASRWFKKYKKKKPKGNQNLERSSKGRLGKLF